MSKAQSINKDSKRYVLRRVIASEITSNWNLRFKLSCGHEVIVRSYKPGKLARCSECGAVEKPYE
jgi:hypothetical protein